MNGENMSAIDTSATERSHSWRGPSSLEREERSYLKMLVADLLYRNQVLRFELMEARDQVERVDDPTEGRSQESTPGESGRPISRPRKGDLQ